MTRIKRIHIINNIYNLLQILKNQTKFVFTLNNIIFIMYVHKYSQYYAPISGV